MAAITSSGSHGATNAQLDYITANSSYKHSQHSHDGGGGVVGQQLGEQRSHEVHGGERGGLTANPDACWVSGGLVKVCGLVQVVGIGRHM